MSDVDATLAFPMLLFALLLAIGPGLRTVVIAVSLILSARFARVVRGEILAVNKRVEAIFHRAAGASRRATRGDSPARRSTLTD